jgi:leader peptidase (prepilin peptidase)/N-methyltransferase
MAYAVFVYAILLKKMRENYMLEIILTITLFLMGIYFGSFFTLATYRLPIKQDITHKHSYCPNCNHKLGVLDLVPIFSYIFLGGKCRYCKNKIGSRYFLFELLTGIVFVLYGLSLRIDVYNLQVDQIICLGLGILYFASLFMLAGINKEKNIIQKSLIYYSIFVAVLYIIYLYTLNPQNVYKYVIYLGLILFFTICDTMYFKKNLKDSEVIQILILFTYMVIATGEYVSFLTLLCTILIIGLKNIITYIKLRKSQKVVTKIEKKPIVFYMSVANIIMLIGTNFITNYMIK